MPWLINSFGREVHSPPDHYARLVRTGEILNYSRLFQKTLGNGPTRKVCLLAHSNGLGDDLHAMPGLAAKVAEGYEVTIYGRPFNRALYESVGCEFRIAEEGAAQFGLVQSLREEFGSFYSLKTWCLNHDEETQGDVTKDRFDQFAGLIDTSAPHEFSWLERLLTREIVQLSARMKTPRIAVAGQSTAPVRSLFSDLELAEQLTAQGLSAEAVGKGRTHRGFSTLAEMIAYLLSVDLVVGVDSGILALALALKRPAIGLFWGTDPNTIARQFARYHSQDNVRIITGYVPLEIAHECQMPCSFMGARGRTGQKCVDVADCAKGLTPSYLSEEIARLFPVLTKPL